MMLLCTDWRSDEVEQIWAGNSRWAGGTASTGGREANETDRVQKYRRYFQTVALTTPRVILYLSLVRMVLRAVHTWHGRAYYERPFIPLIYYNWTFRRYMIAHDSEVVAALIVVVLSYFVDWREWVSGQFLKGTSAHNSPFQCHYMVLRLKTEYT